MSKNAQANVSHDDLLVLRAALRQAHPFLQERVALKAEEAERDEFPENAFIAILKNMGHVERVMDFETKLSGVSPEAIFKRTAPVVLDLEEAVKEIREKEAAQKSLNHLWFAFRLAGFTAINPITREPTIPDLFNPPVQERKPNV